MAPGLDFFKSTESTGNRVDPAIDTQLSTPPSAGGMNGTSGPHDPNVYYNARLDPKNYLEGPLSWNPSTRLRQMLARPGIVVS